MSWSTRISDGSYTNTPSCVHIVQNPAPPVLTSEGCRQLRTTRPQGEVGLSWPRLLGATQDQCTLAQLGERVARPRSLTAGLHKLWSLMAPTCGRPNMPAC